jgi:hypothetical protein
MPGDDHARISSRGSTRALEASLSRAASAVSSFRVVRRSMDRALANSALNCFPPGGGFSLNFRANPAVAIAPRP